MNANRLRIGFIVMALVAINGALSGLGYHGWYSVEAALAASAQEKAQARNSLNQVTTALRSVDTAYASGNAAEAQTKFEEARSNWNKVAPVISAREAREAQLLFDSLGKKLKTVRLLRRSNLPSRVCWRSYANSLMADLGMIKPGFNLIIAAVVIGMPL